MVCNCIHNIHATGLENINNNLCCFRIYNNEKQNTTMDFSKRYRRRIVKCHTTYLCVTLYFDEKPLLGLASVLFSLSRYLRTWHEIILQANVRISRTFPLSFCFSFSKVRIALGRLKYYNFTEKYLVGKCTNIWI